MCSQFGDSQRQLCVSAKQDKFHTLQVTAVSDPIKLCCCRNIGAQIAQVQAELEAAQAAAAVAAQQQQAARRDEQDARRVQLLIQSLQLVCQLLSNFHCQRCCKLYVHKLHVSSLNVRGLFLQCMHWLLH